jgi:hypothetical protein
VALFTIFRILLYMSSYLGHCQKFVFGWHQALFVAVVERKGGMLSRNISLRNISNVMICLPRIVIKNPKHTKVASFQLVISKMILSNRNTKYIFVCRASSRLCSS